MLTSCSSQKDAHDGKNTSPNRDVQCRKSVCEGAISVPCRPRSYRRYNLIERMRMNKGGGVHVPWNTHFPQQRVQTSVTLRGSHINLLLPWKCGVRTCIHSKYEQTCSVWFSRNCKPCGIGLSNGSHDHNINLAVHTINVDPCFHETRISRQDIQNPDGAPFLSPDGSDFLIECEEGIENLGLELSHCTVSRESPRTRIAMLPADVPFR